MRTMLFTLLVSGVALVAQAPPPKIAKKTPLPAAPVQPAENPGAYQDPGDGSVVLPDGRVLVPATQGAPAPAPAPGQFESSYRGGQGGYDTQPVGTPQSQYLTPADVRARDEAAASYITGEKARQARETQESESAMSALAAKVAQAQGGQQVSSPTLARGPVVDPKGDLARYTANTVSAPELAAQKGLALIEAGRIIQMRSVTAANTQLGGSIVAIH